MTRLLVRPFRTYRELADASREEGPTVIGGTLRLLFVIGAVVSVTATGRLAPIELAFAMFSFSWVPLLQLFALAITLRVVGARFALSRAFALHLAGNAPMLVALLVFAFLCLVLPAASTARILLRIVPPLVQGALAWSCLLTYACFRAAIGLSRGRALSGAALHTVVVTAVVLGYFLAMGQLGPLLR